MRDCISADKYGEINFPDGVDTGASGLLPGIVITRQMQKTSQTGVMEAVTASF